MSLLTWSLPGRALTFVLSASSIWCLLAEFYGLCSMQFFTFAVLLPAMVALIAVALRDRYVGQGELWQAVKIGAIAGLLAACAYDVFRLPFVVAADLQWGPDWLRLPLFRVFPRFGAMILGEPFPPHAADTHLSLAAHVVGWIYHFSNGITFGVMYLALVGDAGRRSPWWGVLFAAGLELAMLTTPYPGFFAIPLTVNFIVVTLAAHILFGAVLGRWARHLAKSSAEAHDKAAGMDATT